MSAAAAAAHGQIRTQWAAAGRYQRRLGAAVVHIAVLCRAVLLLAAAAAVHGLAVLCHALLLLLLAAAVAAAAGGALQSQQTQPRTRDARQVSEAQRCCRRSRAAPRSERIIGARPPQRARMTSTFCECLLPRGFSVSSEVLAREVFAQRLPRACTQQQALNSAHV